MLRIKSDVASSAFSDEVVPLKQVRIDAKLRSFAADVTITQLFQNDESVAVEAVYCFPVEENAAIYAFVARIDDEREIVAELKKKEQAQQEYTQALAQGHGAYLLENDEASNDILIVSVGALKPASKCHITISYVSELDLLHCSKKPTIRFVVPTTIAPRYSPSQKGISSPGGTQALYAESVPYKIEFVCQVEKLHQHVSTISSPSHPIKIDISSEENFLVTFAQQEVTLDRDIIIDVDLSEVRKNTIVAVDKGAAMISFMPNEQDCQQDGKNRVTKEFLFVIDCSGSMSDEEKIGLARQAMLLFLKSLPVDCHFNIIRFGSRFIPLFSDQVTREYSESNVRQAELMIKDMAADLGGTELLEPLRWLKNNEPLKGCVRQIFLLTDGEVSNVNEVTNLCREMANYTRLFSFGLGHSPSRALVKGLARATNGYFVFIAPRTNVDVYVAEQLARALQPSMANVYVKWNTSQRIRHTVPEHAPPVFVGDRLLFYALLDETMPFDHATTVELFDGMRQQPIGMVHIDYVPPVVDSQTITLLAAKARLSELLNVQETIGQEVLVNLSIKYNILCPYTAFVGVERRLNTKGETNANMKLREVPIMISKTCQNSFSRMPTNMSTAASIQCQGHHMSCMSASVNNSRRIPCKTEINTASRIHAHYARNANYSVANDCNYDEIYVPQTCKAVYREKPRASIGPILSSAVSFASSLFNKQKTSLQRRNTDCASTSYSTYNDIPEPLRTSTSSKTPTLDISWQTDEQKLVHRFIEWQKYDGLWLLTADEVSQLTKKSLASFSSSVVKNMKKTDQQALITTAIALVILETRCLSQKALWEALSNKAHQRLKELLGGDTTKVKQLVKDIRVQLH